MSDPVAADMPGVKVGGTVPSRDGRRAGRVTRRERRDRWPLIVAAPAVFAVTISIVLVLRIRSQDVMSRYDRNAVAALTAQDYATAKVCFERLLQRAPENRSYRDGLELATAGMSRPSRFGHTVVPGPPRAPDGAP